jgi:hyperosmotically inducible periplasmic protein
MQRYVIRREMEVEMGAFNRGFLFAAPIFLGVAAAVVVAGCDQHQSAHAVGQNLDRASEKAAAKTSDIASRTAAVTSEIASKTAEAADGAAVTAKVKAALFAEPGLRTLQIGVATKDAVVTLSGAVDSPQLKERARKLAGSVAGVHSVVDNTVALPPSRG